MQTTEGTTKEVFSTLTSKGQVTIPAEVRRLLGAKPHDRIAFVLEDDRVRLARSESVVSRTAGAVKSHEPPLTGQELRQAAEEAIADSAAKRMGG